MSKDHQEAMKLWNCHLLLPDPDSPSKAQQQVLQAKLILFIALDSFQKNPSCGFQTVSMGCMKSLLCQNATSVPYFIFSLILS